MPTDPDDNRVVVPPIRHPLSDSDYQELCLHINPLDHSNDNGIDIYLQAVYFVHRKLLI